MGSKGVRKPGSFAHNYNNLVVWNTHIDITEEQLDAICDAGEIQMNESLRKQLKAEIESFASLSEAEKKRHLLVLAGAQTTFLTSTFNGWLNSMNRLAVACHSGEETQAENIQGAL